MRAVQNRLACFIILLTFGGVAARADFFQITSLTTGPAGSFTGTLGGIGVSGQITASPGNIFHINGSSGTNSWEESNTSDTSPQYSYSGVYAVTTPLTDEIGVTKFPGSSTSQLTINFAQPLTNVVFQIANLDNSVWDFSGTSGLTGLTLLSGNGGPDGDGLGISGEKLVDLNPATAIGQSQSSPPLTSGPRSAYGSVELDGTYSSLVIDIENVLGSSGDGLNFTLVSTPEPASVALLVVIVGWFAYRMRLYAKRRATAIAARAIR